MIPLHGLKVVAGRHFLSAIPTCHRLTASSATSPPVIKALRSR